MFFEFDETQSKQFFEFEFELFLEFGVKREVIKASGLVVRAAGNRSAAQMARTRSKFPLRNSRNPARIAGEMKKGARRGRKERKKREGDAEFDRRRDRRSLRKVEGMRSF